MILSLDAFEPTNNFRPKNEIALISELGKARCKNLFQKLTLNQMEDWILLYGK